MELEHVIRAGQPGGTYLASDYLLIACFTNATLDLGFLVNLVPALKHLPGWLPGMGWKRLIREWRAHKDISTSAPYRWAKEEIVSTRYGCEAAH